MSDNKIIKGKRPEFFDTSGVDNLMHMVMVLAQELSATRDRLDTLERAAEEKNLFTQSDIENHTLSQDALNAREARRQQFLDNLFSTLTQEAAQVGRQDTKERFDAVIKDTAKG